MGLDSIVKEIDSAVTKLEQWLKYFKDEDLPFEGEMALCHENLMKGFEANIREFKNDLAMLKFGSAILTLELMIDGIKRSFADHEG